MAETIVPGMSATPSTASIAFQRLMVMAASGPPVSCAPGGPTQRYWVGPRRMIDGVLAKCGGSAALYFAN